MHKRDKNIDFATALIFLIAAIACALAAILATPSSNPDLNYWPH